MTDETTARDRAIEAEQVAIGIVERLLFTEGCEESLRHARTVVRTMRHRPEVLRALAGAPTADVASLRKRIADTLHMGLDDATPNDPMADDDDHARWVGRVQEWADWIHEQYAPLLAAAPEGVDATDELRRRLRQALGIDDSVNVDDDGLIKDVEDWIRSAHALAPAPVPAAPEGVDAADEPMPRLEALMSESSPWDEPDGMDLEAQGEMADQLTAAQAAIQRVREVLVSAATRWDSPATDLATDALRALDGDTTEEKR